MNALLSIKPEFAEKILSGRKVYEFRRTIFSDYSAIDFVYIYSSSPDRRIVGGFTIQRIIEASPDELWDLFGDQSGMDDRERFMAYFDGAETGYAIQVDKTHRFQDPINPEDVFEEFVPPVSFYYLDPEMESSLQKSFPNSLEGTQATQLPQFMSD